MWRITFTADVDGDWTDDACDGVRLRFATEKDAREWWSAHYRGADAFGNQAYPVFSTDEELPVALTPHSPPVAIVTGYLRINNE